MDKLSQLIEDLEQAQTPDEVNQVIDALVQVGEPVVEPLLQSVRSRPTDRGGDITAMRVLDKIGYPATRSALPFVVSIASNQNSPGWEIALGVLKKIGEPALDEIRKTLYFYSQDPNEYSFEIQSLCIVLEQMNSPLIGPLLHELLHLLETGTDENYVDEYALWPIRKIGSPEANEAISLLCEKISSKRTVRIRKAAIEALLDFDPLVIQPLVPILRECLSDESEAVRDSAGKVLKALGDFE
jgi:hypothetical protein